MEKPSKYVAVFTTSVQVAEDSWMPEKRVIIIESEAITVLEIANEIARQKGCCHRPIIFEIVEQSKPVEQYHGVD